MKKIIITAVLSAALLAPAGASAQAPDRADRENAAQFCKALKKASGANFASMFGTKRNAHGKCVSQTAKQTAREDEAQAKKAKSQAVTECRALQVPGSKSAFGKCVSEKAKAKKAEADAEDEAQEDDRVNAAKTCKAAKKDDAAKFAADYGSKRNAFGKCVSRTAKQLAAERKAEEETAPTA
jgi:hypothetical protein